MRLRVVSRGGALTNHANHHNHDEGNNTCDLDDGDDNQQVIKKEVEEEDEDDQDLTLAQFSHSKYSTLFPSTPSPSSQSKEVKDDKLSLLIKGKRNPSTKSKLNVLSDLSGKVVSCKLEKAISGSNIPAQVKSPTVIRAEEIQSSLGSEFPSFVKLLVRSHVSSCFWMGLPTSFCKLHLPKNDCAVILEDESGEQFEIKYISDKTGLSAGWRKFAVGHKLLEGDVLLFHHVEPTKFKVYIVRANDLTEVDGALSLLNLDAHTKQIDADNKKRTPTSVKIKKRKRPNSLPSTVVQKKNKRTDLSRSVCQRGPIVEQSGNDSEEVGSEVLEGCKFSGPSVPFKDVNRFEDFHIVVNGSCLDSELAEHTRVKYHKLCSSKNAFLHNRLLPGLCSKLVAGIIDETVNIADAIKGCKLTTSRYEFAIWEKFLRSFDLLGMDVGFLCNRLRSLKSLIFESEGASDAKRYIASKSGRTRTEAEIRNLEAKLVELKEASMKFDADIESLRSKAEKYEFDFQKEVDAPW